MTHLRQLSAVVLASALLASCAARVTVNELKTDPGRFQNRSVRVQGTVTSGFGAAVVPVGFYTITDGTGEINVLSRTKGAPAKGARVSVKGKVNQVAAIGNRSIGLHLQEENRKSRN